MSIAKGLSKGFTMKFQPSRAKTSDEEGSVNFGITNPWQQEQHVSEVGNHSFTKHSQGDGSGSGGHSWSKAKKKGSPHRRDSRTKTSSRGWLKALSNKASNRVSQRSSRFQAPPPDRTGAAKVSKMLGDTVTSVVISEDRRLFAACSTNKKALVLDASDGSLVAEFTADGAINASAIGLSGQAARLIVGTFSGWIRVYHIQGNREEFTIQFCGGSNAINCMAIAAGATRLAVGGKAPVVLLYALSLTDELVGMNVLFTFPTHGANTLTLSLDAACSKLVAGGESKVVQLWNVPHGGADPNLRPMPGHASSVGTPMRQEQKGGRKPSPPAMDGSTSHHGIEILPHVQFRTSSTVHSIALDATGSTLAVGTSEDTEIYRIVPRDDGHGYFCEPMLMLECPALQGGVAFSRNGQIAIGGNQLVSVFDLETGGMLVKNETEDRVRCVAISGDGEALVVGGFDKQVHLKMIERGTQLYHFSYDGKSVVKAVHLSSDSLFLAMGCDCAGKGAVIIFNASQATMVQVWKHDKAVWAVRFAPDGRVLAAAGFDMALTLYETSGEFAQLQQIKYVPLGGPAFIWSLEWSADGSRLALGCWNTQTFLYAYMPEASTRLVEISKVKRTDRVYAVGLDARGEHLVVAGRDRKVALYDTDRNSAPLAVEKSRVNPTESVEAVLMWEVTADDFVYCVALSSDMQYVAYGGTAKKVTILSAMSGTNLFELAQPGVVWSVALLDSPKGWQLAIGGELPVISVIHIESQSDVLSLPVPETTFDISMTKDSLCYSSGARATMFGAGGSHYGWNEKPSFQVVSSLIMSLLSVEDQLLKTVSLILDRHPAIINMRSPAGTEGGSLLHFVILNTNHPELLERLLNANCRIAMPKDINERSPLQIAYQNGKWRSLQLLLDALRRGRFSSIPGPMHVLNESMRDIAYKYPLDFLKFIEAFELQPEPEVLGEIDVSDVMLPRRLTLGSNMRCPMGMWNEQLADFKVQVDHDHSTYDHEGMRERLANENSVIGISRQATGASGKSALSRTASLTSVIRAANGQRKATSKRRTASSSKGDAVIQSSEQRSMTRIAGDLGPAAAAAPAAAAPTEERIERGFAKIMHTGVRAYRVPFENFAGLPTNGAPPPLQLIVQAVSASLRSGGGNDAYAVFGSQLVEILLDFKWKGFARWKYFYELSLYIFHVTVILVWNSQSNAIVLQDDPGVFIKSLERGDGSTIFLVLLFAWTTVTCANLVKLIVREVRSQGPRYLADTWVLLELVYIVCQLTVNSLFLYHAFIFIPMAITRQNPEYAFNVTDVILEEAGARRLHADDGLDLYGMMGDDMQTDGHGRYLKGAGGGSSAAELIFPGGVPSGRVAGIFVILQAAGSLCTWIRLLYFFKGILRLGTLVHTMQKIVIDITPLLILILVLFIAFWSAIWMLMGVELEQAYSPEWNDVSKSLLKMWNMGLYTEMDGKLTHHTRDITVQLLYQLYMFTVQIVLLNMLIALMAESNDRVRAIAKLVAQFERARLILHWERRIYGMDHNKGWLSRTMRILSGLPSGVGEGAVEFIFPKWLHVLMPAEDAGGQPRDFTEQLAASLKTANAALARGEEQNAKLSRAVSNTQEETKRLASLLVDTQEKHTEMLREMKDSLAVLNGGQARKKSMWTPMPVSHSAPSPAGVSEGGQSSKGTNWLSGLFSHPASCRDATEAEAKAIQADKGAAPSMEPGYITKSDAKGAQEKDSGVGAVPVPSGAPSTREARAAAVGRLPSLAMHAKRMLEVPDPLPAPTQDPSNPAAVLNELLRNCTPPDLSRARKIAERIRHPEYNLKQYYEDICIAFPELRYYFVCKPTKEGGNKDDERRRSSQLELAGLENKSTTSGLGGDQEYLRTVGAFFAVYWLARIGIDGERGFAFGVDDQTWEPLASRDLGDSSSIIAKKDADREAKVRAKLDPQAVFFAMSTKERQLSFYQNTRWDKLLTLLVDGGLLTRSKDVAVRGTPAEYVVAVDRMVGLLALTAIHDLMKVETLLPTVQKAHAPYEGFKAGDKINDHDVALGYVLRYFPDALPSFKTLSTSMRETIQFTQVKIAFNHGWLVQAEAPPGPLFSQFKKALATSNGRNVSDVNFYFVHWLTDLAGAEPTPLHGAEKLVLKFPHPVLHSFISSFANVGALVNHVETRVFEDFLVKRWEEQAHTLGQPPTGSSAIALMRLVAQVQHLPLQQNIVQKWNLMKADDQKVLEYELALTGCPGQNYKSYGGHKQGGPVFLVYYSPAFMRNAVRSDTLSGLRMLADIYRQARSMWPFSEKSTGEHVTIRVDQIKEHPPHHLMDGYMWGESWLLVKRNEREAIVEHHPLYTLSSNQSLVSGSHYRILAFWKDEEHEENDLIEELEHLRQLRMNMSVDSLTAGSISTKTLLSVARETLTPKSRGAKDK